jgi:hypothetical protein
MPYVQPLVVSFLDNAGALFVCAQCAKGLLLGMLTKHQRAVLQALPTDGSFTDYAKVMKRRDTRIKLTNGGYTEPYRHGPITMFSSIRLTAKGIAARD